MSNNNQIEKVKNYLIQGYASMIFSLIWNVRKVLAVLKSFDSQFQILAVRYAKQFCPHLISEIVRSSCEHVVYLIMVLHFS